MRHLTTVNKSLSAAENDTEHREALDILHGLKNFHRYYFAREVTMTADHKTLVATFKKDAATLLLRLQCIYHQYRVRIIYNLEHDLLIADRLLRQNNNGDEIQGMVIYTDIIHTTDIPNCMSIQLK